MNRKLNLALIAVFLTVGLAAQYVPQGMKYQAVARDAKGALISNQTIGLKISLLAGPQSHRQVFSEIHQVTTNELGLFNLTIGEGLSRSGELQNVPWNNEEIFVEIAMQEPGRAGYQVINTSRLFAVPYAFHASTADRLTILDQPDLEKSNVTTLPFWNLYGNTITTLNKNQFLGTKSEDDLVVKTNNTERMRVKADGNVSLEQDLSIGGNTLISKNLTLTGNQFGNDGHLSILKGNASLSSGNLSIDKGNLWVREGVLSIGTGGDPLKGDHKLYVNGSILTTTVKIEYYQNWPDYVFEKDYKIDLDATERYIKENKHLPGLPSAESVAQNGFDVAEMQKILLEKIEELTLIAIEQKKEIEMLKKIAKQK